MKKAKVMSIVILLLVLCLSASACSQAESAPTPSTDNLAPTEGPAPAAESPTASIENAITLATETDTLVATPDSTAEGILPPAGMPDPPSWPAHLPQHVPGSIVLWDAEELRNSFNLPYTPQHRAVFYMIPAEIEMMVNDPTAGAWVDDNVIANQNPEGPTVMPLVRFIQHFNISREDFVAVIEEMRARAIAVGRDLYEELAELPNADIIFTFDNDIIRYFYRRT